MEKIAFIILVAVNVWLFGRVLVRRESDLTFIGMVFVAVLPVMILIAVSGLALAEIGIFSLLGVSAVLLLSGGILTVYMRHEKIAFFVLSFRRIDRYDVIALLVALVLGGGLYIQSSEKILGGDDPASYVSIGVNLARTGAIRIYDKALADVPLEYRDIFTGRVTRSHEGARFPAFYIEKVKDPVITPQFFHVYPVYIAIFYLIAGLRAALLVVSLFGWLSLLVVYLLGRRLIHPVAGLVAMLLLGVNISQIWFSRIPFADVVLQFFILLGFWLFAVLIQWAEAQSKHVNAYALLTGACLGLGHLIKLDVFIIPPVLLAYVGLAWFFGRFTKWHIFLSAGYVSLLGYAVYHGYFFSYPYVADVFHMFRDYIAIMKIAGLVAIPVGLLIIWKRAQLAQLALRILTWREWLLRIFIVGCLLLGLYAYFVRPFLAELGAMEQDELMKKGPVIARLMPFATQPKMIRLSKVVRTYVEEGMSRFGWYFTPLGVWLGVVGFLWWILQDHKPAMPFLWAAFLNTVLIFYRGAVVPHFFWVFKRYVPMIVPAFVLFVVFLLKQLWPVARAEWYKKILPVTITLFLLFSYVLGSLMFWEYREYEGVIDDIEALVDSVPKDAKILFTSPGLSTRLGVPMTYIYGLDVYPITPEFFGDERLRYLVSDWLEQGKRVYWFDRSCKPLEGYHPIWLDREELYTWPYVLNLIERQPDTISESKSKLCIYRVEGVERELPIPENLKLNFGDQITLLGYEVLSTQVSAGDNVQLRLFWQSNTALTTDYKVFVHILDDAQQMWGQKDHTPANGARPASGWEVDEVVLDSVIIPLNADVPPGEYHLQVGLYNFDSLERLSILGDGADVLGDSVHLETILVIPSGTRE